MLVDIGMALRFLQRNTIKEGKNESKAQKFSKA